MEDEPPKPDWDRIGEENRRFLRNVERVVLVLFIVAVCFSCSRMLNPNCVTVGEDRWGNIQEDCN